MEKRKRPKATPNTTERMSTGCGYLYVTITRDEKGEVLEVFSTLGKSGGCAAAFIEGMNRCLSIGLRHGLPPEIFIKQLAEIRCPSPSWDEGEQILSCPDAISKALAREVKSGAEQSGTQCDLAFAHGRENTVSSEGKGTKR